MKPEDDIFALYDKYKMVLEDYEREEQNLGSEMAKVVNDEEELNSDGYLKGLEKKDIELGEREEYQLDQGLG